MASIRNELDRTTKEPNGCKTIMVVCPDGKRRSIRLGKCTENQAKKIKGYIEDLVVSVASNTKPEPETTQWLNTTTATIRNRVEKAGLCRNKKPNRETPTMLEFTQRFIQARRTVKPSTRTKFEQVKNCLVRHFGEDRRIDDITEADAEAWVEWLATEANIREGKPRKDKSGKKTRGRLDLAKYSQPSRGDRSAVLQLGY